MNHELINAAQGAASEASHAGIPYYFAILFGLLVVVVYVLGKTYMKNYDALSTRLQKVEDETRDIANRSLVAIEKNTAAVNSLTDLIRSQKHNN